MILGGYIQIDVIILPVISIASILRDRNAIKMLFPICECWYEVEASKHICGINKTECTCSVHQYKPSFV